MARCPSIAPALLRYFQASTQARKAATGKVMAPLLSPRPASICKLAAGRRRRRRCCAPAAGSRPTAARAGGSCAHAEAEELKPFGVQPTFLDRAGLAALEPHVGEKAIGGVHYAEPLSTSDPGALVRSYAALFVKRGGRMERGDALSLEPSGAGWMVTTDSGRLAARDVVIALGPWSDELARRFGLRLPFFVKRGYHMHYEAKGNAGLTRPVLDLERGYLVTPMARGLRLTTGAEFARRDDPPSPAHLERVEPLCPRVVPDRGPQGRDAVDGPAPLPAGHAPGHRAVPRQAGPLARLRPPPPRPDARPDHRAAAGGPRSPASRRSSIPPRSGRRGSEPRTGA